MRLSKSRIIAAKDFKTYRRKRNIVYSLSVVPIMVALLIPGVLAYAGHKNGASGIPPPELVILLPAFSFFFVILAAYSPAAIASYTIVGEKLEKSLEPLLATPTTDDEILLGKGIAAFIPPLVAAIGGSVLFMVLADLVTESNLGYYYFPNWDTPVILFMLIPLAVLMSVETNIIVSSRVTDVRTGQQVGVLAVVPFAALYLLGEIGVIDLGTIENLLAIAGVVALMDVLLFFVSRATFRREEILTKWK